MLANICTIPTKVPTMPKAGRAVADRAIDLLALVEMGEKFVAIAFEIVADELRVIAVGDKPDALGEERVLDFDLFEPDRSLLACDFGKRGDLVDQFALGRAPHREGKFGSQWQPMKYRGQRETDQSGGKRPTENDDDGVIAQEHPEVATHEASGSG